MKKILIILVFAVAMTACENQENDFPDYDFQTVYFPIQYPARTLVLGESRSDNSIDLEHAFNIGVSVGGIYENTKDRVVDIALAPELAQGVTVDGQPIEVLPAGYYKPLDFKSITIPAGSFNGKLRIDLTDAFFEDSMSTRVHYVIPLKILSSTADSVLNGIPAPDIKGTPDVRNTGHWMPGFEPKDFTLFSVKYINRYHGIYLHRGTDYTLDGENGNPVQTRSYHAKYVEQDLLTSMTTKSLTAGYLDRLGGNNQGDAFKVELAFNDADKSISITSANSDPDIHGTGTYVEADDPSADIWGEKGHLTLYLDYYYKTGGKFHHAKDTLVYRDNNVQYEEFKIILN